VALCQLPQHGGLTVAECGKKFFECRADAVGAFVQDGQVLPIGNGLQALLLRLAIPRQKAEKGEGLCGQAAEHHGHQYRRSAGQHRIRQIVVLTGFYQRRAGVGYARHARVGYIHDMLAPLQAGDDFSGPALLVMLVAGDQRLLNIEVVHQLQRAAGVLAVHRVAAAQRF